MTLNRQVEHQPKKYFKVTEVTQRRKSDSISCTTKVIVSRFEELKP
jgi:hypothetical protein